jgi:DNA repair protein RadA/Sms
VANLGGKSTLLLQISLKLPYKTYVSGEESQKQIKMRTEKNYINGDKEIVVS